MFKASNTLLGETNHQEVGFYDQQTGLWDKNTNITTPELMYSRSKISVRNMDGHLYWSFLRVEFLLHKSHR